MKRNLLLLSTTLLLGASLPLHAQMTDAETPKTLTIWDQTTLQPVVLRLQNAQTSGQLLQLAKASEFNVFADATRFSPTSPPVSMNTEQSLRDWVLETASQEGLSWRRSRERTLLFWKEPDVVAVARALIKEAEDGTLDKAVAGEAVAEPTFSVRYGDVPMQEAELFLADYLQTRRGWDGQSPLDAEFKLSELPPEASAELLRIARSRLSETDEKNQGRWMENAQWLSDQPWRSARLLYSQPQMLSRVQPQNQLQPHLVVRIERGKSYVFAVLEGISLLDTPPSVSPQTAPLQLTSETLVPLRAQELVEDPNLSRAISLEVKEVSFGDLLTEMQKQGGVPFEVSANLGSEQRVTARASALPLQQAMSALSELYGVSWAKTPTGAYVMQRQLSPARLGALQVGDPSWFSYWRPKQQWNGSPPRMSVSQPIDWPSKFAKANLDEARLQTPMGIAVADLPQDLQSLIQRALEQRYAVNLIQQYDEAFADSAQLSPKRAGEITVSVSPMKQPAPVTPRRGVRVPRFNAAPLLKVALVEDGKEAFTYVIRGPQMRQIMAQMVSKAKQRQQKIR